MQDYKAIEFPSVNLDDYPKYVNENDYESQNNELTYDQFHELYKDRVEQVMLLVCCDNILNCEVEPKWEDLKFNPQDMFKIPFINESLTGFYVTFGCKINKKDDDADDEFNRMRHIVAYDYTTTELICPICGSQKSYLAKEREDLGKAKEDMFTYFIVGSLLQKNAPKEKLAKGKKMLLKALNKFEDKYQLNLVRQSEIKNMLLDLKSTLESKLEDDN